MDGGKRNRRAALRLASVVVILFGLTFAAAPLYSLYCKVTGVRPAAGAVAEAPTMAQPDIASVDREVTVRFDTNVADGLPWEFKPLVGRLEVHPGRAVEVRFAVRNLAHETIVGRAIPNIVPWQAAQYFNKTECFCFREQSLQAGESREMTVRFMVSPDLPDDINMLTLSYTFMNRDVQSARKYARNDVALSTKGAGGADESGDDGRKTILNAGEN